MTARRALLAALAAAPLLAAAAPAAAGAATITYAGGASGAVVYAADPGETLSTYVGYEAGCESDGTTTYDCVTFHGDAITAAPTQCALVVDHESCVLDPDGSGVRIAGRDGNDAVHLYTADIGGFPAGTRYAVAVDGGDGNDTLIGGDADETLAGGAGADRIAGLGGNDTVDGGDGNDRLAGDGDDQTETWSGGDDVVRGGPGDDRLTGDDHASNARIGHDVLDGGPGVDTVYDDWYRQDGDGGDADPPPTVTLNGVADDGRPGENDDVVAVETIDTGYQPMHASPGTYTGGDGPDTFHLLFTNGTVAAGAGDDVVTGGDGPDTLDGGAGDDQLSGGFGPDAITGGPGRDDIAGDRTAACFYGPIYGSCTIGSGNDTIYAQDGERDTVDCGLGADVAYVDAIDVTTGCEELHVAGGGSGGGGSGGSGGSGGGSGAGAGAGAGGPGSAAVLPAAKVTVRRQRLARIARARTIAVTCRLARRGRCTVRATIAAAAARKLHLHVRRRARTVVLGSGRRTFKRAGSGPVRVKLSRATARALRRARTLRVTLTVTAVYAGGGRRTSSKRITVRR